MALPPRIVRKKPHASYVNACRLERKPEIRERIEYLTRQAEELVAGEA
jgi:hypothetical protein